MEFDRYYDNCKTSLNSLIDKSSSHFEDKIVYIAAGALGVAVSIFNQSQSLFIIVGSWLLAFALSLNVVGALYIKNRGIDLMRKIDSLKIIGKYDGIGRDIRKLNKRSRWINYTTIASFVVGIVCILLSITINNHFIMEERREVNNTEEIVSIPTFDGGNATNKNK